MSGQTREAVTINAALAIPLDEIRLRASRASGPGGQHVNTADTRVELRWDIEASRALTAAQRDRLRERLASRINRHGELVMTCAAERSQHRNREIVLARLAALLRAALARRPPRRRTQPTAAARARRREQKQRRARVKRDRAQTPGDD